MRRNLLCSSGSGEAVKISHKKDGRRSPPPPIRWIRYCCWIIEVVGHRSHCSYTPPTKSSESAVVSLYGLNKYSGGSMISQQGGALTPKVGRQPIIQPRFAVNCMKMRMHSSEMRTVRCSGRLGGRGVCPGEGVCQWGRGGGVCPGEGCVCLEGSYTSPLWTEFLTHAYENITFPQLLLRTVMRGVRVQNFTV